jgi:hypothetical protein
MGKSARHSADRIVCVILQIVTSAQHNTYRIIFTIYEDKCLLCFIWIRAIVWIYAEDDICSSAWH